MSVSKEIGPSGRVAMYRLPDSELATGSTLGGPKVALTLKGTGAIDHVFSIDRGEDLFGTLAVNYWDPASGGRLEPQAGTFTIHPEHQEHEFTLDIGVQVREDVYILSAQPAGGDEVDPPAVYYSVHLRNSGAEALAIATYAFCQLGGPTPQDSTGRDMVTAYDAEVGILLAWDRSHAEAVRVFGCSIPAASVETTNSQSVGEAAVYHGQLSGKTTAGGGNPLGVFHHLHTLTPGQETVCSYLLTFSAAGQDGAKNTYRSCPTAEHALAATLRHYHEVLSRAVVLTPNRQVNHGALWAKANMLRVEAKTLAGWSFTNTPTHSNKAVARDVSWFAFGADYMTPRFMREALLAFVERQKPNGMIIEDYDFLTGETEDDGLNINDDTPLLILALRHHYEVTGDADFLRAVYPAAAKAARYIVSQENEQGLVWCSATGLSAKGIIGWRNVIKSYRLSGATIEVNAECFGALEAAAHMAGALDKAEERAEFHAAAAALKEAINRHLLNPHNGLYYRNIDLDGAPRDEVISDLVFPLMYEVASEETAVRIIQRLSAPDFWTEAGIRTAPRTTPSYSPDAGYGLLGGVWVGVTYWFASVAARYLPALVDRALGDSFQHYSRNPRQNNTVPGQFSEWLHGESLVNQGMMLSPWFAPRYLWAVIESVAGLQFAADGAGMRLEPHLAPAWQWLGVANLPYRGKDLTWVTVRAPDLQTYGNFDLPDCPAHHHYPDDISNSVHGRGDEACALGWRRHNDLLLFAGSTAEQSLQTVLQVEAPPAGQYRVRRLDSIRSRWVDGGTVSATQLRKGIPLQLERQGFCLLDLSSAGS